MKNFWRQTFTVAQMAAYHTVRKRGDRAAEHEETRQMPKSLGPASNPFGVHADRVPARIIEDTVSDVFRCYQPPVYINEAGQHLPLPLTVVDHNFPSYHHASVVFPANGGRWNRG